ncbi:MAG: hypothetical protein AB4372_35305 [Xenococcus sp. (in: cyanobacteria)]
MSKKISIFSIFVYLVILSLSLFNNERSVAQISTQEFLDNVYNRAKETCQPTGPECSNCVENLTQQIVEENQITNPRVKKEIYDSAIKACE